MKQTEPTQGCLLALKDLVLNLHPAITQQRKFQIPFFYYKDKKLCFLWVNRKKPLIGFVEDNTIYAKTEGVKRKDRMETLYVDPYADLPMKKIVQRLRNLIAKYDKASGA